MKDKYEELEIEVIRFDAEDVIVTSDPDEGEGMKPTMYNGSGSL